MTELDLIVRLKNRIKTATNEDRLYERPMSWDEAEQLLGYFDDLEKELYKAISDIRNLQDQIMGV